jgi:peptidoglycan/xylan/chitin deacetylase (PgdA/CDA1 family)
MQYAIRIPVLMYHRIGDAHNAWEAKYCVSPQLFSEHMHMLATHGMRACAIDDFIVWLNGGRSLPKGSFLLTFDDGFLGVYEHAAPVLGKLRWPATVFLVSQLIGKEDEWCRADNPSGATYPLLSLEHIRSMRTHGFSFHSHTRQHADLPTLSDAQLKDELSGSKQDLEALLGEPVLYLAYPFGHYDEHVLNLAKQAGYAAAFSVQPGFNRVSADRFRIRRLDIFGTDTPAILMRKIKFGSNDGSIQNVLRYYWARFWRRLGATDQ